MEPHACCGCYTAILSDTYACCVPVHRMLICAVIGVGCRVRVWGWFTVGWL